VIVGCHLLSVADHLRARGLFGGDRLEHYFEIEARLLGKRVALSERGNLDGTDHINDELAGGSRADTPEPQDAL